MVDRPIIYANEQGRSYDFLTGFREMLYGIGKGFADIFGSSDTVVSGLAVTAASGLAVTFAAGRIYKQTTVDSSEYGTIGTDSRTTVMQGMADAQSLTFVTSGMSSGQGQYALVQATFTETDEIPDDDPNSGIMSYYNADDPENSLSGPEGDGTAQDTRRTGVCTLAIKYGTAATSGSEVAPSADSGYVPLYLIDLTYGQTAITTSEVSTDDDAPFLAGLLSAHHSGGAGQAPQIDLTAEVQNELPMANLASVTMAKLAGASSSNSGGGIATCYSYSGDPNGNLAGTAGVAGTSAPDTCYDTENETLYYCTSTGTATTAVWTAVNDNPFSGNVSDSTGPWYEYNSKTNKLEQWGTVSCEDNGYVNFEMAEAFSNLLYDVQVNIKQFTNPFDDKTQSCWGRAYSTSVARVCFQNMTSNSSAATLYVHCVGYAAL